LLCPLIYFGVHALFQKTTFMFKPNTKLDYFFVLFFLLLTSILFGEGTKQLAPNPTDRIYFYTNSTAYNDFGRYDGSDDQRLYVHIDDPATEQLFLGFSQPVGSGHHPCNGSTPIIGFFRIKDPTGRVVYPIRDNISGQILDATTANITTYSQAAAGPAPIVGGAGYAPFVFDPSGLPAGDYYVEFSRVNNAVSLNNPMPIEWFDLTVATKSPSPTAINGRVFSRNWAFFAPSTSCGTNPDFTWFDRPFNGKFYIYTDQNIVTSVDFNGAGFQPAAFNVVFNDAGTTQTNNVIEDRKSLNGIRSSAAQHRIFLNDPDINVYPSGVLGRFLITPKFFACENGTACVETIMTEPGQIDVLIDLDRTSGDFIFDKGTADVLIAFQVNPEPNEQSPYTRCVPWDGRDGFGNKIGGVEDLENTDLLIRYTQGIYHFPIYDAEYVLTGYDVTTIRPLPDNGSPKKIYYDDTNIPDAYGTGITQTNEDPFNGCDVPCHPWTNKDFGDLNTINTWFFAREEYEQQTELGGCPINAINDTTETPINTPLTIQVLLNDLGTENIDTTNIKIGFPSLNGNTQFDFINLVAEYAPASGFIGLDSFTYVFCYGILPVRSLCDSATVFVTITPLPEDCTNNVDDDGDGMTDCDDPDCQLVAPSIYRMKKGYIGWLILLIFGLLFYQKFKRKTTITVQQRI